LSFGAIYGSGILPSARAFVDRSKIAHTNGKIAHNMKKALGRWGQKAGESVGMVKRTTEVDEDFAKQVAASECRKDVQEKLVKHLTPDSMKGNLFSKNDLSQEEKMGEFLVKSGNTLAGTNDGSAYASALIAMGEMLKEIGEQHRQTDATIDERTIQPMKHFLDTKHVPPPAHAGCNCSDKGESFL
jgi:hypothetical protein